MKKKVYLAIIICAVLLLPFSIATIAIDPLQQTYNIGDDMTVKLTISTGALTYGFVSIVLSCSNGEVEIYRAPLQVKSNEQKSVLTPIKLDRFIIGDLEGNCTIHGNYSNEKAQSASFEITSDIIVSLTVPDVVIKPGNNLFVRGTAFKRSGKVVDGFVDVSIPELQLLVSTQVRQGVFNASLRIPRNARSQTYGFSAVVREYGTTVTPLNEGTGGGSFRVPQVPASLDIAVDSLSIMPGAPLIYTILLKDQADYPIISDSVLRIFAPGGAVEQSKLVSTEKMYTLVTFSNTTPGLWKIQAAHGILQSNKTFIVEELSNISFTLINNTLTVNNVGNIPYKKDIAVSIGDTQKVVAIDVGVGDAQRFELLAPAGSYPISIMSGNVSNILGSAFLVGNVIGIKSADSTLWNAAPWFWWAIIILIAAFVAVRLYLRVRRTSFWARTPQNLGKHMDIVAVSKSKEEQLIGQHPIQLSSASLHSDGKQECAIVAVNIRNQEQINSVKDNPALDAVAHIVTQANNARARVYHQGSTRIMIFSLQAVDAPAISALMFAKSIERIFLNHNLRYALKISFGIGVHTGSMIMEIIDGKPKFTSVGTTVVVAKKLAESARNETLLSNEIYRVAGSKVKATKIDEKRWRLGELVNRSAHSDFLKRFMQRQDGL